MRFFLLLSVFSGILVAGNVEEGVISLKNGDYESAMANFIYAANSGDKIAQQNLGVMYYAGLGVPIDRKQAAYWFNKASSYNDEYRLLGLSHGVNCGCRN
jgi:TPR repeat protein